MRSGKSSVKAPLAGRAVFSWHQGLAVGGLLALVLLGTTVMFAIWPFVDPMATDLAHRFARPGEAGYLLGSDQLGRDTLARVLSGLGWTLAVAAGATFISAVVGIVMGLLAADRPGLIRVVVNQLVDMVLSFPGLVIAIVVVAAIGHGYWALVLTLGLLTWPVFARVVYAEAQTLLTQDYVLAARLSGSSRYRILAGHLLPGLKPSLTVMLAFHFADMMIAESALSFLGVGAPLGTPSLGNMLAESRQFLFVAPELMLAPATVIVLAVIAANLLGDGLSRKLGGHAR